MFGSGLLLALRRAVHPCQSFSRCRVAHDIWRSGQCRAFGRRPEPEDDDVKKPPRPKTVPVPRITLVSPDNSTTVTVLEEAQRLAKRRNLTLIKVSDLEAKSQRPIYKLVSSTGILEEFDEDTKDAETDRRDKIVQKDTKLFYISAKITEHDLQTKTKNVLRQLTKRHKVKIVITLDGADGVSSVILPSIPLCVCDGVTKRYHLDKNAQDIPLIM